MIKIDKADCHGCHGCKNICPTNAITMEIDDEGFWYPSVKDNMCIKCGLCINACSSLNPIEVKTSRIAYAAMNSDLDIRLMSSSGGIFSLLSEYVIGTNGVVFGAAFDDNNLVKHISVTSIQDLGKLRGSKYVQSEIGDSYKECKKYLSNGKHVLFSGTPCQITGLKSFLQHDYENLLTVDIICHGVPSPKVWDLYKLVLSKNGKVSDFSFRVKNPSWENYSIGYTVDEKVTSELSRNNTYMKAFLNDLCLRPSCYSCKSKTLDRHSDITIGDFWGIDNVVPQMNDKRGTSLIVTHNDKANELFLSLGNKMSYSKVSLEEAIRSNSAMVVSAKRKDSREIFMAQITDETFEELTYNLTKIKFGKRVYLKVRAIASKFKKMLKSI